MNPLGIIFDFDGTMVENIHIHSRCWSTVGKKYGVDIDDKFYRSNITGNGKSIIVNNVLSKLMPVEDALKMFEEKEVMYREQFVKELALIAGLENFLIELAKNNIPAMIATNAPLKNMEACHQHLKLDKLGLSYITVSDTIKGKPAPDMFLKAAEIMNVRPENCLVFEDSTTGFEAAEAAGMKYIAVTLEKEPAPQFTPVRKIKDFSEFSLSQIKQIIR